MHVVWSIDLSVSNCMVRMCFNGSNVHTTVVDLGSCVPLDARKHFLTPEMIVVISVTMTLAVHAAASAQSCLDYDLCFLL